MDPKNISATGLGKKVESSYRDHYASKLRDSLK